MFHVEHYSRHTDFREVVQLVFILNLIIFLYYQKNLKNTKVFFGADLLFGDILGEYFFSYCLSIDNGIDL